MAVDDNLPWFPCYPSKLLGALAGMKPDEGYVYWVVCLRIYETGGPCRDTVDALARRTGLTRARVSASLDLSFAAGRLVRKEAGIENPFAAGVLAEMSVFREGRKQAGKNGALARWGKPERNQRKRDGTAMPEAMANDGHLHLQVQDSLFPNGNRADEASAAMKDPPPDPEADLYRRGREVLGSSSGGMITQLIRAKGGNVALARAAIEQASTRGDAREYVGAMVRDNRSGGSNATNRNGGGGRGGHAVLGAQLRRKIAERAVGDAGPGGDPARGERGD